MIHLSYPYPDPILATSSLQRRLRQRESKLIFREWFGIPDSVDSRLAIRDRPGALQPSRTAGAILPRREGSPILVVGRRGGGVLA